MSAVEEAFRAVGIVGGIEALVGEGTTATLGTTVPGLTALASWRALRALLPPLGFWPVLLGDADAVDRLRDYWEASAASEIEHAAGLKPKEWLEARSSSDPHYYERVHGAWPAQVTPQDFVIPTEILSGRPLAAVHLGAVPSPLSWEAPAYLAFGGWNECPLPREHVAMLRYWFEACGAEVVGISDDIVECAVSRPPLTREAALVLADEQFVYCADIVGQGAQTLEGLAAVLLGRRNWYFWWD